MIPELVIATIVVIVVKLIEYRLIAIVETLVNKVELYADTWMEAVWILMVTNEENVTNQSVESITQPDVNIRVLTSKGFLNLSLCIIRWTHLVSVAPYVFHILLSYLIGMLTENTIEHPVCYKWFCEQFFLPV